MPTIQTYINQGYNFHEACALVDQATAHQRSKDIENLNQLHKNLHSVEAGEVVRANSH